MKKVLYTLLAMVSMLVTACSNEEIGIEVTYPKKDVNISIATSDAYNTCGQLNSYESLLGKYPNNYIEVTSLVYNSHGTLVDKKNTYLRQFQQENHKFTLDNGEYTVLVISTIVEKKNYSYTSDIWNLVEEESLSKVSLEEIEDAQFRYWYNAIYYDSKKIKVDKQDVLINVNLKQIGSFLQVYAYNFDKTNDIALIIGTTGQTSGVKLDPTLIGKDRYYYKQGINKESDAILGMFYDEKFILPNEDYFTLYILEEAELPISLGCADKKAFEAGRYYPYHTFNYSFESCSYNFAGYYYIGGKIATENGSEIPNYVFYLGDNLTDFDTWYNNAKTAYEEYLKNNNGNGNTTTDSWKSIGTGTYRDAFVGPLFGLEPVSYNVEIMEHVDSAGLYRIMNPYSNNVYPYADNDCAAEGSYLLINACDANGVFIPEQSLGLDWGYGEMQLVSEGGRYLSKYDFETVKNAGYLGKVENGVITLPSIERTLSDGSTGYYQGIMYMGVDGYYCGTKDGFRVTLPYQKTYVKSHFVKQLEETMHYNNAIPKMTQPRANAKKESRKQLQLNLTRKIVDSKL